MSSENYKVRKKRSLIHRHKKRKLLFWIIFAALSIVILFIILTYKNRQTEKQLIRVGICGAIHIPAVYTLNEGSDLGMLIRLANGLRTNADVHRVNPELIVKNDSIYHIPFKSLTNDGIKLTQELLFNVDKAMSSTYTNVTKDIVNEMHPQHIKVFSILYVGMPAVFVLINYYPDFHRINFVHLPHTTRFLNNDYRLIDLFFTLDVRPTMDILEHTLKQKIDYYMIQNRDNFIEFIDRLDGIVLNIDEPFAKAYNINSGRNKVDGFQTWEYIRFLDWSNIKLSVKHTFNKTDLIRTDNFKADPRTWQRIYEIRNQRQRYVIQGMRSAFISMSKSQQIKLLDNFRQMFNTDMTPAFLIQLYTDLLTTKDFNFGSLPGYYSEENDKLFFYPDLPNFRLFQDEQIRTWLEDKKRQNKSQTTY